MKNISILGVTGSIGTQTLDVISSYPEHFNLIGMSFGKNITSALDLIHTYLPKVVSVKDKENYEYLRDRIPSNVKLTFGKEGLIEVASHHEVDILVNAVVGSVGLEPTLAAIEAGKSIAIANKETLVTAGHLVMEKARKGDVSILPVDSEHSAIFQCLRGEDPTQVDRIILTASGGSFRDKTREELKNVSVDSALNHPNWSMGAKITIDSATMMNKGLEVIEAHWLFDLPYDQIEVVLHKESIVHSMVEFKDKGIIAQLGTPDMRVPIQYALSYPDRLEVKGTKRLNLVEIAKLHFQEMSFERFPCLKYAYDAGAAGGTMPTVLNAANEEAVGLFLENKISFLEIEKVIESAMLGHHLVKLPDLHTINAVDQETRQRIRSLYK